MFVVLLPSILKQGERPRKNKNKDWLISTDILEIWWTLDSNAALLALLGKYVFSFHIYCRHREYHSNHENVTFTQLKLLLLQKVEAMSRYLWKLNNKYEVLARPLSTSQWWWWWQHYPQSSVRIKTMEINVTPHYVKWEYKLEKGPTIMFVHSIDVGAHWSEKSIDKKDSHLTCFAKCNGPKANTHSWTWY